VLRMEQQEHTLAETKEAYRKVKKENKKLQHKVEHLEAVATDQELVGAKVNNEKLQGMLADVIAQRDSMVADLSSEREAHKQAHAQAAALAVSSKKSCFFT
jgi:hypothetical protein